MKIGIIGSGPWGMACAGHFSHMGAHVCLFDGQQAPYAKDMSQDKAELLKKGIIKKARVNRIQKRFLELDESINDKSRLHDLFRVTYSVNPSDNITSRMEDNPEVFEKLGQQVLDSLKNDVEAFEDFDLIIDARGPYQLPLMMGVGGDAALNEKALMKSEKIYYGKECLSEFIKDDYKTITIVGSSFHSMIFFSTLSQWLSESGHELNIITTELNCFESVLENVDVQDELKNTAKELIKCHMKDWRANCDKAALEIQKWRDLPSHEKVKITMPQMPEPKLKIYEGYSVTSVDRLLDRDGLFLTLEMPSWRDPKGEKQEMLTVKQEAVFVLNGFEQDKACIKSIKNVEEPGFYSIEELRKSHNDSAIIDSIEKDIMSFFSRA
jgi:hypothetical protein